MKKKLLMMFLIVICLIPFTGCNSTKIKEDNKKAKERAEARKEDEKNEDAIKFKEEYEKLNGTKNDSGKTIRSLSISKDNPFVYKKADDIVELIDKKEKFIVYFGFSSCPWCRSVLPSLLSAAKDYNVDKIYYVDIKDIRDTLEADKRGNITTKKKGSEGYYKLLEKFEDVLDDYKVKNSKGKEYNTGEKRIFAPNVIVVVDGKAKKITTGISDKQDDAYMELTDDMKKESYEAFEEIMKAYSEGSSSCSMKEDNC